MSNPTDSDRATAKQVIDELLDGIDHWEGDPQAFVVAGNAIAAALAAEREACAAACDGEPHKMDSEMRGYGRGFGERIRALPLPSETKE